MVYDTSLLIWAAGASRGRLLEMPDARGHLVESAVGAYLLARGKEEGFLFIGGGTVIKKLIL
jgi:hypothetical protein